MTEAAIAPGQPFWADIISTDFEPTVACYRHLFGWDVATIDLPDGSPYTLFSWLGDVVAGGEGIPDAKGPPAWTTFIFASDVESLIDRLVGAGGTVLFAPEKTPSLGTIALASDPTGATFGILAPQTVTPIAATAPGRLLGASLLTPDPDVASTFYETLFGWRPGTPDDRRQRRYEWFQGVAATICTAPGENGRWLPCLATDNVSDACARLCTRGGRVIDAQHQFDDRPAALVEDQVGAAFLLAAHRIRASTDCSRRSHTSEPEP